MRENAITRTILVFLKRVPDCFAWKVHGGAYQRAGLPDISIVYRGRAIYLEVKQPGKRTTPLQELTHEKLRDAGAEVYVVTSLDDVKQIMRCMEEKYATI